MDRRKIQTTTIRQQQVQEPLFELSRACSGCGETPYLKLLWQLFRGPSADRKRLSRAETADPPGSFGLSLIAGNQQHPPIGGHWSVRGGAVFPVRGATAAGVAGVWTTTCRQAPSFAESLLYFPQASEFRLGPEGYLEHIRKAKEAVDIPVISSLNGAPVSDWAKFAKEIEQAGADALECNIYHIPTDPELKSADVEQTYVDIVWAVESAISIPVAVKISPFFSNLANMAKRLDEAGANGLVLFNRFYQPDIDWTNWRSGRTFCSALRRY